jgi:hypothetical protein
MKFVLQNRSNLSYVEKIGGAWTKDVEQALEFPSSLDALLYCFNREIIDMQMVTRFADPTMNFSMLVTDVRVAT